MVPLSHVGPGDHPAPLHFVSHQAYHIYRRDPLHSNCVYHCVQPCKEQEHKNTSAARNYPAVRICVGGFVERCDQVPWDQAQQAPQPNSGRQPHHSVGHMRPPPGLGLRHHRPEAARHHRLC